MCIAPEAVMGMHICNTFIHPGLVPSHIHAVILEERLHDLASNSPSLCFLFVLLFDTTPRSLSRTGQPVRLPAAYRHHRNSTSSGFSGGRPHCVVPGQGGCDWTEVSLSAIRGHGDSTLLMIDWESGVYRSCLKMYCTSMDRIMSCRQSSRTPHVAFVPHDRTANVTDWLDMKLSVYGGQAYSHPF